MASLAGRLTADVRAPVRVGLDPTAEARVLELWATLGITDGALHSPELQERFRAALLDGRTPAWKQLVEATEQALARDAVAVVLEGSPAATSPLLAAVACCLGTPLDPYGKEWSRLLQPIKSKEEWTPDLEWHTDSTSWPSTNDLTCLACERPAPAGGATDLLRWETLALALDGREELRRFVHETRLPFDIEVDLGGGRLDFTIMSAEGLRFMRGVITPRSADAAARLEELCLLLDSLQPDASVRLAPGEVLLFDNRRRFHRRSWVEDPELERLLVRTKIRRPRP